MKEKSSEIVPTLAEFEQALLEISHEAAAEVNKLYEIERANGHILENGNVIDDSSIGSTVMFLKKRSPLYKFLSSIPYIPEKFYFVTIYENVHISLRNVKSGQSYILNKAASDVIVTQLRERFGWEIFSDVRVD